MTDPPTQPAPTGEPDHYPGTPRWVKGLGVIAVIVVLLIAFVLITGIGGPHGPQRHGASAGWLLALDAAARLA